MINNLYSIAKFNCRAGLEADLKLICDGIKSKEEVSFTVRFLSELLNVKEYLKLLVNSYI